MCLEVVFKTGKSLRQSDRLWETVPDCRTSNRKGSVSILILCIQTLVNLLVSVCYASV